MQMPAYRLKGKVPSIFRLMRTRYPDISLVLQDLTTEEQVEAIQTHRLDLGLVRPPVMGAESLKMQVIWREPLVVALPRAHPLATRRKIAMKALAEEAFLQIPRHLAPGFYDQFIRDCGQAGFSPKIVQEARTTQTIVSLIDVGMGVSIVPASLQSLQRTGVVYRPLAPPAPTTDLAVIWRPDDKNPAFHSFLKIIWEVAEIKEEQQNIRPMPEGMNDLSERRKGETGRPRMRFKFRPFGPSHR
jgi:DNA-binding transcriptional LysR family regulator